MSGTLVSGVFVGRGGQIVGDLHGSDGMLGVAFVENARRVCKVQLTAFRLSWGGQSRDGVKDGLGVGIRPLTKARAIGGLKFAD